MAKKRTICNYANASNETPKKGALYQRGKFYIMQRNQRRGDRQRYVVFMNEDLLGLGGSLQRLKRFVNQMYKKYPFETSIDDEMVKQIRKFGKIAQMDLRPRFDDTIDSIREAMEKRKERLAKTRARKEKPPVKKRAADTRRKKLSKRQAAKELKEGLSMDMYTDVEDKIKFINGAYDGEEVEKVLKKLKNHRMILFQQQRLF